MGPTSGLSPVAKAVDRRKVGVGNGHACQLGRRGVEGSHLVGGHGAADGLESYHHERARDRASKESST